MNKVLIVDDEQTVVDCIKLIVNKSMNNSLLAYTARSGREAIEKAEIYRPDIVIIDIKMPGINGLEAISEIKKIYSGALFIIMTEYENFEVAKEALKLGVIEYLNKPLSRNKVITALENAIKLKKKERSQLKTELDFKEKMAFILPLLESNFIYSIIFSDNYSAEIKPLKKLLDLRSDGGYILTIKFGEEKNADALINKIGLSIKSQNVYSHLRDAIKEFCKCIVGPIIQNRIIVYVPCDCNKDEYQQRIEALKAGTAIYKNLQNVAANIDFYIGIGKSYPALRDIYKSYEESLRAIDYSNESCVLHINDIPIERDINKKYPKNIENKIIKNILAGETEASLMFFEHIFNWITEQCENNISDIKSNLIELVVTIYTLSKDYGLDESVDIDGNRIIRFLSINDIHFLKSWLKGYIKCVSNGITDIRNKKLSGVIKSAVNYISDNFKNEITLEDVSLEVNVSPTYFSKLFKEETGTNFIDYLTSLRIEEAKKLISNNRYGNKEICHLIGYSDPNYFSRVFKKAVGVTPTAYKAAIPTPVTY